MITTSDPHIKVVLSIASHMWERVYLEAQIETLGVGTPQTSDLGY